MVTNVALAKVCALPSGLNVCMYVTNFSQKLLDRIAWNFQGWFVIIQGPIDQIFGSIKSEVKVKVTKSSKIAGPNCMKLPGMICHHPRTNWTDFGSDQVKGQGQGHEKAKNVFLS